MIHPWIGRRIRIVQCAGRDLETKWKPKEGATGKILAAPKDSWNHLKPNLGPFVDWDDRSFRTWLDIETEWEFIE